MSEETRLIKQTAMVREANEFSDQVLQCKKNCRMAVCLINL